MTFVAYQIIIGALCGIICAGFFITGLIRAVT